MPFYVFTVSVEVLHFFFRKPSQPLNASINSSPQPEPLADVYRGAFGRNQSHLKIFCVTFTLSKSVAWGSLARIDCHSEHVVLINSFSL